MGSLSFPSACECPLPRSKDDASPEIQGVVSRKFSSRPHSRPWSDSLGAKPRRLQKCNFRSDHQNRKVSRIRWLFLGCSVEDWLAVKQKKNITAESAGQILVRVGDTEEKLRLGRSRSRGPQLDRPIGVSEAFFSENALALLAFFIFSQVRGFTPN